MGSLRRVVSRGLAAVGLAPARQIAAIRATADKDRDALRARAQRDREQLEQVREDAKRWKAAAQEHGEKVARIEQQLQDAERRAERAEGYLVALRQARERIKRGEHAIALSREHLMSTETKLDLVEGAIAVLDQRTRD